MKTEKLKKDFDTKWEENFQLLLKYKEIHSTTNLPGIFRTSAHPEWKKLSIWCATQRHFYKKGLLKKERCERLKTIGFNLSPLESEIDSRIEDLLKFKEKYGHLNVPLECTEFSNLGKWVCNIRNLFISEECIKKLNSIGFDWELVDKLWLKKYFELSDYKEKYGHFEIKNKKFNPELFKWMNDLRKAKKEGNKVFLSNTKINLLNDIGFQWELVDKKWDSNINKLKEFKELNGHSIVPMNYRMDPSLGRWVGHLRKIKAKLSAEQIELLDSMGFEWDGKIAQKRRNGNISKSKLQENQQ